MNPANENYDASTQVAPFGDDPNSDGLSPSERYSRYHFNYLCDFM